jgi:hypothetical protein
MSDVLNRLTAGLNRLKAINSATLSYTSGSTEVSCSVFKSMVSTHRRAMTDAGYEVDLDDVFVLATPSDVSSWGLQEMTSEVRLDGVAYMLGQSIVKTPVHWEIWLRVKK